MIAGTWIKRWIGWSAVLALVLAVVPGARAQDQTAAIDRAVAYMRTQQQADGSFAGFGPGSTADAVFALAAAGENVAAITQGDASPITYIESQVASNTDIGVAAKFVIALLLAGRTPSADLIAQVEGSYNATTSQYGADITAHAYALIALTAAGRPIDAAAIDALKGAQQADGGWSFDGSDATDTNTTSLAIQALVATGEEGDALTNAIDYLRAQQNDDGGFPYSQSSEFGNASDANSTALSAQALIAAGEDVQNWAKNGTTPTDRLAAFQNNSGAFRFQDTPPDDNQLATYQAVPALAGATLPLEGIVVAQADPSVAPSAAPSATPSALPNTGATDYRPVLLIAALVLLVSGFALKRRRA